VQKMRWNAVYLLQTKRRLAK